MREGAVRHLLTSPDPLAVGQLHLNEFLLMPKLQEPYPPLLFPRLGSLSLRRPSPDSYSSLLVLLAAALGLTATTNLLLPRYSDSFAIEVQ
jgi:hypothetical protein